MRIDLPGCGFKDCKYNFDCNCNDRNKYEKCEYKSLHNIIPYDCDYNRIKELIKTDKEGRCTIFPCCDWLDLVFGDQEVFYGIDMDYMENPIREITVYNEKRFTWYNGWENLVFCGVDENGFDWEFAPEEVGKSVFRTYKEAESALKAMKESEKMTKEEYEYLR